MVKKHPLVVLIVVLALMSLACGLDTPESTVSPTATPAPSLEDGATVTIDLTPYPVPGTDGVDYSSQIAQEEGEDWGKLKDQIQIQPLTEDDLNKLDAAMKGEDDYSLSQGQLSWDGNGVLNVNPSVATWGIGENVFVVPSLQLAPSAYQSLYQPFVEYGDATNMYVWEQFMHWTGHMENRYALAANGAWFNQIIQGAIRNEGVIYKLAGTDAVREQYLFVTRISSNGGPSMPWGVILAPNGAPITGYNTGMKGSGFSEKEAARFVEKMLQRGYVKITAEELPEGIRQNWTSNGAPPVLRYWLWSIGYQIEMYARIMTLSISEAAANLLTWAGSTEIVPIFIIMPDCDIMYMPGICQPITS